MKSNKKIIRKRTLLVYLSDKEMEMLDRISIELGESRSSYIRRQIRMGFLKVMQSEESVG